MRYGAALLALSGLGACIGEAAPPSSSVQVEVSPLSLTGITDARYTLTVTNAPGGLGEVVWSRTVTSDQYGDGAGSLSYVGPCDGGKRHTVTLVLDALYAGAELDTSTYENPTPVSLEVDCLENRDVPVRFDITLMRQADQGFFDVAVQFEDIFCSAKLDCQNDAGGDLELLFNGPDRDLTAVLGFACTSGEGQTWLYMDDLVIDCAGSTLDVRVAPTGLGATTPTSNPNDYLFAAATYRGLGQGGVAYWNVALGLDATRFGTMGACTLKTRATASSAAWNQEPDGFPFPLATVYPVIEWEVVLSDAQGRECTRHEVGSAEVKVEYVGYLPTNALVWADQPLYMQHRLTPGAEGGTVLSAGAPICNPSCDHGTCVANGVCACEDGWDGERCDEPVCEPACINGGDCVAPDTCDCLGTGFSGEACELDIDECAVDLGGCEQVCNNTSGGFGCACTTGYVLDVDGASCDDINECATNNGGCAQTCTNSVGARACSCLGGYVLNANGTTCDDIDECLTDNGGCAQTCTNTAGGRTCGCEYGTLQSDGVSCVLASCSDILAADPDTESGVYLVDPNGGSTDDAFSVWCDMVTDGGGWTLVAKVADGVTGAHRTQSALSTSSLTSTAFTATAKLSDATINALRGNYANSILRIEAADGKVDYFRENKAFDALATTSSMNQVYASYATALARTGVCSGTYNSAYHTGLVGWGCHDSFLYADNPGFRTTVYQAGRVWVKKLRFGDDPSTAATSCLQIKNAVVGAGDGAYWIETDLGPRRLYCDMSTDGGGWTLVGEMSMRANVYDTWLRTDLNVADLETVSIGASRVASVGAVGMAVFSATQIRFSNAARDRWVRWPLPAGRTTTTWWNHAAGQTAINAASQTTVTVTSQSGATATCYQNIYGIMPLAQHGGSYPAASINAAGNTNGGDLCMAVGVLDSGSANGFTTNGNGFDAPSSASDWPNAAYNVAPLVSVWLR